MHWPTCSIETVSKVLCVAPSWFFFLQFSSRILIYFVFRTFINAIGDTTQCIAPNIKYNNTSWCKQHITSDINKSININTTVYSMHFACMILCLISYFAVCQWFGANFKPFHMDDKRSDTSLSAPRIYSSKYSATTRHEMTADTNESNNLSKQTKRKKNIYGKKNQNTTNGIFESEINEMQCNTMLRYHQNLCSLNNYCIFFTTWIQYFNATLVFFFFEK